MDAASYDAWYATPRGHWVGDCEFRLLANRLCLQPGESLLDIGCGTGYFTRRFVRENPGNIVVGLDPNPAWLRFARAHCAGNENFVVGEGGKLPFPDKGFDFTVSVAALCFAHDQAAFLSEMVRVTRRRFALGLLNRNSLLYPQKGLRGGTGAYRGAQWHNAAGIHAMLSHLPVSNVIVRSGVFLPGGGFLGNWIERMMPDSLLLGAFLAVTGECR